VRQGLESERGFSLLGKTVGSGAALHPVSGSRNGGSGGAKRPARLSISRSANRRGTEDTRFHPQLAQEPLP
jgi:hypothetical protein